MRKVARSLATLAIIAIAGTAHADIAWQKNLRAAHSQAQAEGKLLLLHFYSDNCAWCERLEQGSFKDKGVDATIAKDFVPVKVHANSSPRLVSMFKVTKFPTDIVVSTDGKTLSHSVSPQEPQRYVAMLAKAIPNTKVASSTPVQSAPENTPSYATLPPAKNVQAQTVSTKAPESASTFLSLIHI